MSVDGLVSGEPRSVTATTGDSQRFTAAVVYDSRVAPRCITCRMGSTDGAAQPVAVLSELLAQGELAGSPAGRARGRRGGSAAGTAPGSARRGGRLRPARCRRPRTVSPARTITPPTTRALSRPGRPHQHSTSTCSRCDVVGELQQPLRAREQPGAEVGGQAERVDVDVRRRRPGRPAARPGPGEELRLVDDQVVHPGAGGPPVADQQPQVDAARRPRPPSRDSPTRRADLRRRPDRSPWVSSRPWRPCRRWLWSTCRASVDLPQSIGPWKKRQVSRRRVRRRSPEAGTARAVRRGRPRHRRSGGALPAATIARRISSTQDADGTKKITRLTDRDPVGAGQLAGQPERERAQPAGAPVADLVEAVVLGLLADRDQLAEQRPGQRLGAAEHDADRHGRARRTARRALLQEERQAPARRPRPPGAEHGPLGADARRRSGRAAARRRTRRTAPAGSRRSAPSGTAPAPRSPYWAASADDRLDAVVEQQVRAAGTARSAGSARISRRVWPSCRKLLRRAAAPAAPAGAGRLRSRRQRDHRERRPPGRHRQAKQIRTASPSDSPSPSALRNSTRLSASSSPPPR